MESPKYLIIITLIDGQNFTLPDGAPDKIEASVFAEARFGNESYLKSDSIKLTNSNPEFVTELAWQVDKRSLHQLRVERRAIRLQIFLQTKEKRKTQRQLVNVQQEPNETNGTQSHDSSGEAHHVELVGYTIIDIRSAQETDKPKFQWLPLLNPKFRKPSYNRPEVQLALTLHRVDEENDDSLPSTSLANDSELEETNDEINGRENGTHDTSIEKTDMTNNSQLYKTCLDFTLDPDEAKQDEIIENDLKIKSRDGIFHIYDTKDSQKSTIDDCDELYRITIAIPFNSDLCILVEEPNRDSSYYFSVSLFGSARKTENFKELTSLDVKEIEFLVATTHSSVLATYFELNSNLVIKLHRSSGEPLGLSNIQLDQLCSLDSKRRSIEGIFALQSISEHDIPSAVHPSIGVSVVLERMEENQDHDLSNMIDGCAENTSASNKSRNLVSDNHIEMAKEHFGQDIDNLFKSINDTNQVTFDSNFQSDTDSTVEPNNYALDQDDHHFCFTIDLKEFSYTPSQRVIPTLRSLVVRYSYPFFGYQDTITTDTSLPISPNNSIIVSGFCEFNFATTFEPLLTALNEIPLNLDILTCEESQLKDLNDHGHQRLIATCCINLADIMCLDKTSVIKLKEQAISTSASVPVYGLDGLEIGNLHLYLCLLDRGRPSYDFKASIDNLNDEGPTNNAKQDKTSTLDNQQVPTNSQRLEAFIGESKLSFETWKEDFSRKLSEEIRKRENERFKRLYQRLEAKDARREQEFKKKIEELTALEKRFRKSLACAETLERTLNDNFEQMKSKDALLDSRLETLDLKISQAVNNIKTEYDRKINSIPTIRAQRSLDESQLSGQNSRGSVPVTSRTAPEITASRRISLRTSNNIGSGSIPVPVRSTSLVRGGAGAVDGPSTRFVKRPVGIVTTVVNGASSRSRPSRISLSKETQEKLASLRREKAELLKRGCKPNDELIQEINSLIEKLVC